MEKTFKYDPKVGWNWHKSWNLPTISIIISVIPIVTDSLDHTASGQSCGEPLAQNQDNAPPSEIRVGGPGGSNGERFRWLKDAL